MGLIERLTSWLGLGGDADRPEAETAAGDTATADAPDEDADGEPRLDPEGATETRVETTGAAVDALREARNTADTPGGAETTEKTETTERTDLPNADDEDGSGDTVDADDPTGG